MTHRVIAQARFKLTNEEMSQILVMHINGNVYDNNIENLKLVPRSDKGFQRCEAVQKVQCIDSGRIYDSISKCAKIHHGSVDNLSRHLNGVYMTFKGKTFRRLPVAGE